MFVLLLLCESLGRESLFSVLWGSICDPQSPCGAAGPCLAPSSRSCCNEGPPRASAHQIRVTLPFPPSHSQLTPRHRVIFKLLCHPQAVALNMASDQSVGPSVPFACCDSARGKTRSSWATVLSFVLQMASLLAERWEMRSTAGQKIGNVCCCQRNSDIEKT